MKLQLVQPAMYKVTLCYGNQDELRCGPFGPCARRPSNRILVVENCDRHNLLVSICAFQPLPKYLKLAVLCHRLCHRYQEGYVEKMLHFFTVCHIE